MPHVAITMIPGRGPEEKMKLAKKVHKLLTEELQIDEKFISVSVEDIEKENWQASMDRFSDDVMYVKPGI